MHSAPPSWPGTVAAVPRSLEGHSEAAAVSLRALALLFRRS